MKITTENMHSVMETMKSVMELKDVDIEIKQPRLDKIIEYTDKIRVVYIVEQHRLKYIQIFSNNRFCIKLYEGDSILIDSNKIIITTEYGLTVEISII